MVAIIDNLRDALLLTLVVVLMYILYKRLLRVLGKDAVSVPRFDIAPGSEQLEASRFSCTLIAPVATSISFKIFEIDSGKILHEEANLHFEQGEHPYEVQFSEIPRGMSIGADFSSYNHKIFKILVFN